MNVLKSGCCLKYKKFFDFELWIYHAQFGLNFEGIFLDFESPKTEKLLN